MFNEGGKGSRPRPYSVDQKTFDNNWDRIFKKDKKENTSESTDEKDIDPDNPDKE